MTPADAIAGAAEPLPPIDDPDFASWVDRYADARVILLGEASHGTSDFYRARAAITRRLIERHGFRIVAVEADWPDAASIDRLIRHRGRREGEDAPFQRFPTWMWRNTDVAEFLSWLAAWNEPRSAGEMVSFHGLDLYNLGASMRAVIDYLDETDPDTAALARERYACLQPWVLNPAAYGHVSLTHAYARCETAVVAMLRDLQAKRGALAGGDGEEWLDAAANARLVKNAEAYYRAMYMGDADSWNLRDTHMFETLCQVLEARGADAKAVVWAHNSHIGNGAYTEMGWSRGEHNIGQLTKERFGDAARLIGFGTHEGTVAAAHDWDGRMQVKDVRPGLAGSIEAACHVAGQERFVLDFSDPALADALAAPMLQRFIGVIYRPATERWSHYAESVLPKQYDAFVWLDRTEAVTPLSGSEEQGAPDTFPFGL